MGGGAGGGPKRLFRIITEPSPEANFLSNRSRGLPPRGPEVANPSLHSGLSMFDSLEAAATKVPVLKRGGKHVYGIGEIEPAPGVTVTKTLKDPAHFTVHGSADDLMASWVKSWIRW